MSRVVSRMPFVTSFYSLRGTECMNRGVIRSQYLTRYPSGSRSSLHSPAQADLRRKDPRDDRLLVPSFGHECGCPQAENVTVPNSDSMILFLREHHNVL